MSDPKTIVFFPEGAFGPTNNCVGIGQVLKARGHRVVFIVEESFAGSLEAQGFEERLMRLGPAPEVEEALRALDNVVVVQESIVVFTVLKLAGLVLGCAGAVCVFMDREGASDAVMLGDLLLLGATGTARSDHLILIAAGNVSLIAAKSAQPAPAHAFDFVAGRMRET